jgi:quercetin dioxygenase-like cupin family protein
MSFPATKTFKSAAGKEATQNTQAVTNLLFVIFLQWYNSRCVRAAPETAALRHSLRQSAVNALFRLYPARFRTVVIASHFNPKPEVSMHTVAISVISIFLASAAWAQQPPALTKTFSSAADVAALLAKAKADHKDGQPTVAESILRLAPYNVSLEYRSSVGPASVHEHEAEIFYVLDGSGTLTTGGKLANEKRTNAENLSGTAIEGGNSQALAKGDFAIVPENTPHWISAINGTLVLMSLHVPRTAAAGTH